jgi:DNA-binding CsgD family transcriptional regulator
MHVDTSKFERALSVAHAASAEHGLWPSALAVLAEAAGAAASLLLPADPAIQPIFSPSGQGLIEEYVREDWGSRNLRIQRAMRTPVLRALARTLEIPHRPFASAFVSEAELFPGGDFAGSVYYEDFMARHRLRWCCGAPLLTASGDVMFVTFERKPDQEPFQRSELEKLNHLLPQLQSAATLTSITANATARGMLEAFDTLDLPTYLVDGKGCVTSANLAGDRLAADCGLLHRGRITAEGASGQASIDALIAAAVSFDPEKGRELLPVRRNRTGRPPLMLHAIALPRIAAEPFSRGRAAIVVVDPERRRSPEETLLCTLYDLTPAEARVARAIAQGLTVSAIAARFGLSPLTVRSQLKSVLAKTGSGRQSELVLQLSSILSPRTPR